MGLDISMYKTRNFKKYIDTQKVINRIESKSEKAWESDKKYEEITESEREHMRKKGNEILRKEAAKYDLRVRQDRYIKSKEYLEVVNPYTSKEININSEKYPDHLFKIGYFRSSYNSGGINHVLRNTLGYDLYNIFGYKNDKEFEFLPNWEVVREKTIRTIEELKTALEKSGGVTSEEFDVITLLSDDSKVNSEKSALDLYIEHLDRSKTSDSSSKDYSNRDGEFHLDKPMKVKALIRGTTKHFFSGNQIPCVYIISESVDKLDWYIKALEIIVETCDFVLKDKRNKYYISWSA